MKYNFLGKSDLKVSETAFGCMSLGQNQSENDTILHKAFHAGINFFDTADLYNAGLNEETVGQSLKNIRKEVIIATKVGNQLKSDGSGWDWNPTKSYILEAVEKSLRRLQTDYIDLYQLHGGTIDDPMDETIEAFELLKSQGKIREYGISSIRPNVIREYIKRSGIVSVMMQYSLLDRRPEESCLDLLQNAEISVITRGSLAQGLLVNKPPRPYLSYSETEVSQLQAELKKTGHPVSVSLSYVLRHPAVASVVVGARTPEQLQEILESRKTKISPEVLEKLSTILEPPVYENHR